MGTIVTFFSGIRERICDRPSRHRFSLVSLGPRANAEMVPFYVPSCRYMLPV